MSKLNSLMSYLLLALRMVLDLGCSLGLSGHQKRGIKLVLVKNNDKILMKFTSLLTVGKLVGPREGDTDDGDGKDDISVGYEVGCFVHSSPHHPDQSSSSSCFLGAFHSSVPL